MKLESIDQLFLLELRDLHSAKRQLTAALPKIAAKVKSPQLRKAIEDHLEQTIGHVERLEQIFQDLELPMGSHKCKAMEGLIAEGDELLKADADDAVRDAALIGAAQRVEHYEMAGYGTARTYAEMLGFDEAAQLLQETLDEEGAADKLLTELAVTSINAKAQKAGA